MEPLPVNPNRVRPARRTPSFDAPTPGSGQLLRNRSLALLVFGALTVLTEVQYGLAKDRGHYWDFFPPFPVMWVLVFPVLSWVALWIAMSVRSRLLRLGPAHEGYGLLALGTLAVGVFVGPIQTSVGPAVIVGLGLVVIGARARDGLLRGAGAGRHCSRRS